MPIKSLKKTKTDPVVPPKIGEILEGKMLNRGKSSLFLDLGPKGIGIIYGREFFDAKNTLKSLNRGDTVTAKVTDLETDEGYRELSLVGANQELAWKDLIETKEKEETIEVEIKSANKGGLICELAGIDGFLPASQLLPEHYPKVEDGDPLKIAGELQKLVGTKISVRIYDVNSAENKLIFSEKATKKEKLIEKMASYKTGDEVEGEISGVTNFGAFLVFDEGLEGLIPATEISETAKPSEVLKIGQKVKAKITEISNNRIYFSIK